MSEFSLLLSYVGSDGKDVLLKLKLPHREKKLGSVAKAFAKSYGVKHGVPLDAESLVFRSERGEVSDDSATEGADDARRGRAEAPPGARRGKRRGKH